MFGLGRFGMFTCGVLLGSAGFKVLGSRDARKVYAHVTAAALRMKEDVMTKVTSVREHASDILAEAHEINEKRSEEELKQ